MLRELISIFRKDDPLADMGANFARMLDLTLDMTIVAGEVYFGNQSRPADRTRLYEQDVSVNKLERAIRKQVVAHLSVASNTANLPYCLFLMSLVKDVERIGDYAKNLAEVYDVYAEPLPDDDIVSELQEIQSGVEEAFRATGEVFSSSDRERANELIHAGRDLAHRSDALIARIARSDYESGATTALVLGTRYYKRIGGHVLNVLSSVVMPLHKLDYYDEDALPPSTES